MAVAITVVDATLAQPMPVHHWPLDASSGTHAVDLSGGSHGLLQGGVSWSPNGGHHAGAARFDGVSGRIVLGACDPTNGGGAFSIALWVKPDIVSGMERTLIAKATGPQATEHVWSIAFINATALRFRLRTAGVVAEATTPPSSIFSGAWYHIAAAYDGMLMRLWVNGALVAATPHGGLLGQHPQVPASLGALHDGTRAFSGWIDDVRLFGHGLTEADVIGLLFASVPAAISEAWTWDADGGLQPPPGPWQVLQVFDGSGRLVHERPLTGGGTAPLPLAPGSYAVCLRGGDRLAVRKLFVP